jgi:hypothetical protein
MGGIGVLQFCRQIKERKRVDGILKRNWKWRDESLGGSPFPSGIGFSSQRYTSSTLMDLRKREE